MITYPHITYKGKKYHCIEVSNENIDATFASLALYDAISEDVGWESDADEVWNEIYYFTDLVDKYKGAEFVRELIKEDPEFLGIFRGE